MKTSSWFKDTDCVELTVIKYKSVSDDIALASITIKDKAAINDIADRIRSLPPAGAEMIKMGPKSPRTHLSFKCGDGSIQVVEFLDKRIKTPSTGFLGAKNAIEDDLYRDLDGLVQPDLNKRIPKIKNHRIEFKEFIILFTGAIHTPQPDGGPTVGPTSRNFYSIWKEGSANTVSLEIFDGQISPGPEGFLVGKKIYYLLTFENGAHERLYPKHFEVSEKIPRRR